MKRRSVDAALRAGIVTLLALPAPLAVPTLSAQGLPGGAGVSADDGCRLCHGELELLRQQVPSLDSARALLVPHGALETSAHDTMSCGSCHVGFSRFPHPAEGRATEGCASCHQENHQVWDGSIHAGDEGATCVACHGVHDVTPADGLSEPAGIDAMNGACVGCHEAAALPPTDPHADTVSCASCHTPHDTQAAAAPGSAVAPMAQTRTCGACHDAAADSVMTDAHHTALAGAGVASLAELRGGEGDGPPTCTSCHGAHGMLAPSHSRFDQDMVGQCAACHADYADTYFGTYHGKATAAGSEIVATCDHCHGSHQIFPASEPRSMVSEANLVGTCATCHEQAGPSFVLYDSHPDPLNRDRNPPLFYSFVLMNALLAGVLFVFTLHTALWWVRLMIDKRKGVTHGIGVDHG